MSTPRNLPHKSTDPTFALEVLKMDMDNLVKRYEYVLNPENSGDTIANYFETLTTKIFQTAISRFFLEGMSSNDFIEMLKESSLAACNYFKLITNRGKEIQYTWEGEVLTKVYESTRIHHTAGSTLDLGLKAAIISQQKRHIECLSNIDLTHIGLHRKDSAFDLRALALQLLCGGGQKNHKVFFDAIEKLPSPSKNLDAKLMYSDCKTLLALEKKDTILLAELIDENLSIHKKMYDNDARNMRYNLFGLMSIHNLVTLILANKKGMSVEVSNPYIPHELLTASIKSI